ncbi:MAG: TPM domain-containing protein [Candidatus Omnitrophica bacterium]|nr:TPM domain-containing protein [Candidatus Omnitrophota bacterium]
MRKIPIVLIFLAVSFVCLHTASPETEDVRFPAFSGFVNDYATVLSAETKGKIEALITEVEKKTSAEIAVAVIKTTGPLTIEQYATGLFEKWGIGKKGEDNGILIVVAVADRKARIEVGYGLEDTITDLRSKLIIENQMVPYFKKGDYNSGIFGAVSGIAVYVGQKYGVKFDADIKPLESRNGAGKESPMSGLLILLFFVLIFGMRFGTLLFLSSGGTSHWSGGNHSSFGGGFGGFGGGFSGGGGSSGSW